MQRELPNLDWLRVFAACADAGSFVGAADLLGVTPGAVSQRIKALEVFLDVPLFDRFAQGVQLTEAGRRYAADVRPAIAQLLHASRAITRDGVSTPVRITILPALAQLWLGQRLADFHRKHEGISVEIWADPAIIDLRAAPFDIALRYGRPPFPGCDSQPFLFDELVPVASPTLLERCDVDPLGLPRNVPLLLDTYWNGDYDDWLGATGQPRIAPSSVQTFSLYSMVVEATLNGQGFMMGHTSLLRDLIAAGRLAPLSEHRIRSDNQFYCLTPTTRPLQPSTRLFWEWLAQAGMQQP